MILGYTRSMRAVMLEVPEHILEERRRNGWDKRDEVWEGVLHMVPPASTRHNFVADDLLVFLRRVGERRGLLVARETGVFDPAIPEYWSYRVPDLAMAPKDLFSERGVEGRAKLVVEVLSPNDESREKLPFYARVGVEEVWIVNPVTKAFELFELDAHELTATDPQDGVFRSRALDIAIDVIAGPKLRLRDADDAVEI
jgi:Uma2 family endonuclease